jgi:hypothetical protein
MKAEENGVEWPSWLAKMMQRFHPIPMVEASPHRTKPMTNEARLLGIQKDAERFDEPARSVMIALGEFQNGIPVDQSCPLCRSAIRVWMPEPNTAQVWLTSCACDRCNNTFRGL